MTTQWPQGVRVGFNDKKEVSVNDATMTPDQARKVAKELLLLADFQERSADTRMKNGCWPERVPVPKEPAPKEPSIVCALLSEETDEIIAVFSSLEKANAFREAMPNLSNRLYPGHIWTLDPEPGFPTYLTPGASFYTSGPGSLIVTFQEFLISNRVPRAICKDAEGFFHGYEGWQFEGPKAHLTLRPHDASCIHNDCWCKPGSDGT